MNINEIVIMSRFHADGDANNMPVAAATDPLLISINNATRKVYSWIRTSDGRWQWDDSNETDFPIATTTLVNGQRDYQLDTAMLEVEAVEVLDEDGNYYTIKPIDKADIKAQGISLSEYQETSGRPLEYDLGGSSIVLYPAPDNGVSVTLAAGLRIRYKRGPDPFTAAEIATGTKQPGFASHLHEVIPKLAALPFVSKKHPERLQSLLNEIGDFPKPIGHKEAIIEFYSTRQKDEKPHMTMEPISYR